MSKSVDYQFQMHDRVSLVCNVNKSVLDTIVAYFNAKLNYDNSVLLEKELAEKKESFRTTSVIPRNLARGSCNTFLLGISSKLMSYSLGKNNMTMYGDVKLTKSEIKKVSNQKFVSIYKKILKIAADNLADLADYNITAGTITTGENVLQNLLDELQVLIDRKSAYKEYTLELNKQIKITNGYLKTIDPMVNSMEQSEPNLYSRYWDARGIKKTGGSKVVLKCKIFDSVTLQPLPNSIATITAVELTGKSLTSASGADLVKTVKVKSAGGGINLKSLPTGTYQVTVTFAGYATQVVTCYVNEGLLTTVDVPMSKLSE